MNYVDKTQAFLWIEARSQLAEDAFALPGNNRVRVPTITKSGIILHLRLDHQPKNPYSGHVLGSSEEDCDVLLDTVNSRGVSSMAFSIVQDREWKAIILKCLAPEGILYRDDAETDQQYLEHRGQICLQYRTSWVITLGSVQIALTPILRDPAVQKKYIENFNSNTTELVRTVEKAHALWLATEPGATSASRTSATRLLTGIWGQYTTGRSVGEGSNAKILACKSTTFGACCLKEFEEAKGDADKFSVEEKPRQRFKKEIQSLRKVAHRSIVRYIDHNEEFTWMAMEFIGDTMEFVRGRQLEEQLRNHPFTMRETEVLTYQLLDALSHIHSCGIIHHDINTYNILVQSRTENHILVKLIDFGAAVQGKEHPTDPLGRPLYWAPECFIFCPDKWTKTIDVWALAMVALKILFGWPFPPVTQDYGPESPLAEGWRGAIESHLDKEVEAYLKKEKRESSRLFNVLSWMFAPTHRISASMACEQLREGYQPDHFLSLGMGDSIPIIKDPVIPTAPQSKDESIFHLRKLDVAGSSTPLSMWTGSYLIDMDYVLKAKYGRNSAREVTTAEVLAENGHDCYKFKVTGRFLKRYITIDLALEICGNDPPTRALVAVLQKWLARQRKEEDKVNAANAKAEKENKDLVYKPTKDGPNIFHRTLIGSVHNTDSVIAITEEGRMLLVRASDGYIHVPSLHAARAKRLLEEDDVSRDVSKDEYVPLEEAMMWPDVMSRLDIASLGAATYCPYG